MDEGVLLRPFPRFQHGLHRSARVANFGGTLVRQSQKTNSIKQFRIVPLQRFIWNKCRTFGLNITVRRSYWRSAEIIGVNACLLLVTQIRVDYEWLLYRLGRRYSNYSTYDLTLFFKHFLFHLFWILREQVTAFRCAFTIDIGLRNDNRLTYRAMACQELRSFAHVSSTSWRQMKVRHNKFLTDWRRTANKVVYAAFISIYLSMDSS